MLIVSGIADLPDRSKSNDARDQGVRQQCRVISSAWLDGPE
jgi:hypothetical protein